MTLPYDLNLLDIVLLAVLALFTLRGFFRGFVDEVAGLIGILGGVILAGKWYAQLGQYIQTYWDDPSWPYIVAYVLILCGVLLVVAGIARLLHKLLSVAYADWLNHLAGGGVGFLKGFVIAALLVGLLGYFLGEAPFMRESRMVPHIKAMSVLLKGYLPGTMQDAL